MNVFRKILALVSRCIVGAVFVFSGFVKAVDPLGTAYKIQDYLEAFNGMFFYEYALFFSFFLFAFELILGLSLLLGSWQKKTAWTCVVFLSLMTLLTLYLAIANPISDCGCFGDAIVLTNWQTFGKNVILLLLALCLLSYRGKLYAVFGRHTSIWAALASLLFSLFIGTYSCSYLPLIEFLPYKVGTDIEEKRQIPEGMPTDSVQIEYIYEKNGVQQSFTLQNYPAGDTTWHFVERKEKLIRKGYEPPIRDFELLHPEKGDISDEVLANPGYTFLWVAHRLERADRSSYRAISQLFDYATAYGYAFYGLTSSGIEEVEEWRYEYELNFPVCSVDEITLKTMIRSNPGLILLKNGVVYHKWPYREVKKILPFLDRPLEESELGLMDAQNEWMQVLKAAVLLLILLLAVYIFRGASLIYGHQKKRKNRKANS